MWRPVSPGLCCLLCVSISSYLCTVTARVHLPLPLTHQTHMSAHAGAHVHTQVHVLLCLSLLDTCHCTQTHPPTSCTQAMCMPSLSLSCFEEISKCDCSSNAPHPDSTEATLCESETQTVTQIQRIMHTVLEMGSLLGHGMRRNSGW